MVASHVLETHGAARVLTNLGRYQDSKHLHWHIYAGAETGGPEPRLASGNERRLAAPA